MQRPHCEKVQEPSRHTAHRQDSMNHKKMCFYLRKEMKVAASSLSIGLQMSAPSGIGHGSIRSRGWAVGWTNEEESFGSVRDRNKRRVQTGARAGLWALQCARRAWYCCWGTGTDWAVAAPVWSVKKNSGQPYGQPFANYC